MTVPAGTPKNIEWADRMRQALQIAGSNIRALEERLGAGGFGDIGNALRKLDEIADELAAFNPEDRRQGVSPRPWIYGYRNGEDRPDTDWGGEGFWDAEGKMVMGTSDGWDGEWKPPSEEDAAILLSAVNSLKVTYRNGDLEDDPQPAASGLCKKCGHEAHGFEVAKDGFSVVCGVKFCQCRGM